MAERWLRWYDGTVRDGKMRIAAELSDVPVCTVIGVWASLLEDAATNDPRGIATRGVEHHAMFLGITVHEVTAVWNALERTGTARTERNDDGDIEAVIIINWNTRQYETDDKDPTSKARKYKWKQTHKWDGTLRNDQERPGTPETETETETETEKKSLVGSQDATTTAQFEEFWRIKPRRKGDNPKAACLKAFNKAIKAGAKAEEIIAAARRWAASIPHDRAGTEFVPMAVTWLNQQRWDSYLPLTNGAENGHGTGPPTPDWESAIGCLKRIGRWPRGLPGGPPGDLSCEVPHDILRKHGFEPMLFGSIRFKA